MHVAANMTSTLHKSAAFKFPRIRTKDALFKTSPEIAAFFGEAIEGEESYAIPAVSRDTASRSRSPVPKSPRLLEDDFAEDIATLQELEEVKKERNLLMRSIAQCKTTGVVAGGEAQDYNISQLMKELKLKKDKLNDLRQEGSAKEAELARLVTTAGDCEKLTLSNKEYIMEYIDHLNDEMSAVKENLVEVEAKNRLYTLLRERTRQEHQASEQRVRASRELRKNCKDDVGALSHTYHNTCSLKEEAEKKRSRLKKIQREIQKDWQRKLKDRRKEVRAIRRTQLKEKEKEARRLRRKQAKEEAEMQLQVKKDLEHKAMEEKVRALAPKIESMEAAWSRLCSVARASSCDEIIDFWNGLKNKQSTMQQLVDNKEEEERNALVRLEDFENRRTTLLEDVGTDAESKEPINRRSDDSGTSFSADRSVLGVAAGCDENRRSESRSRGALHIRVYQGLRELLRRIGSLSTAHLALLDEADFDLQSAKPSLALQALFDAIAHHLTQFKQQTFTDQGQVTTPITDAQNGNRSLSRDRNRTSYAASFKKCASRRQVPASIDVTQLVGYIDDDQETSNRNRAAEGSDVHLGTEAIIDRSFLKARSMRFTLRSRRQVEA